MRRNRIYNPKLQKSISGSKNGQWKETGYGLGSIHEWVIRRKLKPKNCSKCKKVKSLDLANKSGKYLRNLFDWKWLCRRCHMKEDGRMNNLKQYKRK